MAEVVTSKEEISLGGTRFPIVGRVRPHLISVMPGKVTIGDYSLADELIASSWVISDQRGGILIEEMEEKIHQDRCYWSTCNLGFKGHIVLPALATDCGTGRVQTQVAYVSAGAGSGVAGNVTPGYPASMDSGDLMILQVTVRNLTDTPTTPTGWTALLDNPDATSTGKQWLYYKFAHGAESGTLTVTTNSTDCCIGRIYAFRNVVLSSFKEGGSFGAGTDDTIECPSVTTTSTKRLVVAFVFVNDDNAVASFTGESGGDLTEAVAEFTSGEGSDGCVQLQTATMAAAGTVSGGAQTMAASDPWGVRAFALIPATPGTPDVRLLFEYSNAVYALYDNYLQIFDDPNDDFLDNSHIFPAIPTDVMVYKDAAIVALNDNANIQQKGLPSLTKFIDNPYFKDWSGGYPTDWGFELPTGATVDQNTDTDYINKGKFSVKLTGGTAGGAYSYMRQKLPFSNVLRGLTVTVTAYGHHTANGYVGIGDGAGTSTTAFDGTFQQQSVAREINAAATCLEIEVRADGGNGVTYIDDLEISISGFTDWVDMGQEGKYLTSLGDTIYMVDTDGKFYTSKVGIEYTEKCQIPEEFSEVNSLFVYRDVYGNSAVYVGTDIGNFVYDSTNERLLRTELSLPHHPLGAVHPAHWREALYVPAGLDVLKYIAQATATITSVGLDKNAGLPAEYQGEITALIKGYNDVYALVDSTYGSGTVYSSLMAYDGLGWQCKWLSGTAGKAIKYALITGAYDEYRLFWGADNKVYHITLERNLRNPLKLSTYTFESSGIHITPWFDAGWIGDKLALTLSLFCKDTTANETVQVSYRTDHSTENIGSVGTEWASLGTVVLAGDGVETEYEFASGVGEVYQSIQFRLDLTTTDPAVSPDVQWVKLKYLKLLDTKWGWATRIDCSGEYKGSTSAQLTAALKTLVATQTLAEFTYRDESGGSHTYYVRIANASGAEETGADWAGQFDIALVEP